VCQDWEQGHGCPDEGHPEPSVCHDHLLIPDLRQGVSLHGKRHQYTTNRTP
jgi:hypothetical protein